MRLVKEFPELFREVVEIVARESGGLIRVHRHYSGRGMMGDQCLGITIDRDVREIELGARLMLKACETADQPGGPKAFPDDVLDLLEKANADSMGMGTIIYFPSIEDPFGMIEEDFV